MRGATVLAATLDRQRDLAMLFKDLATLRTTVRVGATAARLQWSGPRETFKRIAIELGAPELVDQAREIRAKTQP